VEKGERKSPTDVRPDALQIGHIETGDVFHHLSPAEVRLDVEKGGDFSKEEVHVQQDDRLGTVRMGQVGAQVDRNRGRPHATLSADYMDDLSLLRFPSFRVAFDVRPRNLRRALRRSSRLMGWERNSLTPALRA